MQNVIISVKIVRELKIILRLVHKVMLPIFHNRKIVQRRCKISLLDVGHIALKKIMVVVRMVELEMRAFVDQLTAKLSLMQVA